MKKIIIYCISFVLLVGGVYVGATEFFSTTTGFAEAYTTYQQIAAAHDTAAFYPSTNQNPIRRDLNRLLSEVLVGTGTKEERKRFAEEGLKLIPEADAQVDLLGDFVPRVEGAIAGMEARQSWFQSQKTRAGITRVLELSRRRLAIIADIRGLSYRANFHTREIFKRVIEDGGQVTAAHTKLLNDEIPQVEEQFDKRTNLYTELESTRNALDATVADILE